VGGAVGEGEGTEPGVAVGELDAPDRQEARLTVQRASKANENRLLERGVL